MKTSSDASQPGKGRLRHLLHTIIYEADTPAGKLFDLVLFGAILLSVAVVLLESVDSLNQRYGVEFRIIEWVLTVLFAIEYALRIYAVKKPWRYIRSFYGIVDFLAILPSILDFFISGAHMIMVIRVLRLLRVFRILKLVYFIDEARQLVRAMHASRIKIALFMFFVVLIVTVIGSVMYVVEGQENEGFRNIPVSIYWAVVTLTTVGFGDITPKTGLGQFLSAVVMVLGYAVLAVPTGIVTMELVRGKQSTTQACPACGVEGHDDDADYCKYCGHSLEKDRRHA